MYKHSQLLYNRNARKATNLIILKHIINVRINYDRDISREGKTVEIRRSFIPRRN